VINHLPDLRNNEKNLLSPPETGRPKKDRESEGGRERERESKRERERERERERFCDLLEPVITPPRFTMDLSSETVLEAHNVLQFQTENIILCRKIF